MNKQGTFMWAVEQMKLGKKVRMKSWDKHICIERQPVLNSICFKDDIVWSTHKENVQLTMFLIEATDWVVVDDDKDWNLADKEVTGTHNFKRVNYNEYIKEDVKKCRDLILEDINIDYTSMYVIKQIINKRFGDL